MDSIQERAARKAAEKRKVKAKSSKDEEAEVEAEDEEKEDEESNHSSTEALEELRSESSELVSPNSKQDTVCLLCSPNNKKLQTQKPFINQFQVRSCCFPNL